MLFHCELVLGQKWSFAYLARDSDGSTGIPVNLLALVLYHQG